MKPPNHILVIAGFLLFCLCTTIVSADNRIVGQGEEVYIQESLLDVTHALNSAQGSPVEGVPPFTQIGWWASAANLNTTAPTVSHDLSSSYKKFFVDPLMYSGYEGNWYVLNGSGHPFIPSAFVVNSSTNVSSCLVISSPGYYNLQNDILNSGATRCIDVRSSDVTFDGNGHLIDGVDAGNSYGVWITNDPFTVLNYVTVKNAALSDWGLNNYGIQAYKTENCTIINNIVSSSGNGIWVSEGPNSVISDNDVSGNAGDGIVLTRSDDVRIYDNIGSNEGIYGIVLTNTNRTTIINNTLNFDQSSGGLGFTGAVRDSNVTANWFQSNRVGIDVSDSPSIGPNERNHFTWNTFKNSTMEQIYLVNSSSNDILNNVFQNTQSSARDIWLISNSSYNNLVNNTFASNNGYAGIVLAAGPRSNSLNKNTFSGDYYDQIAIASSDYNELKDNRGSGSFNFIDLSSANYNAIDNNSARETSDAGFELHNSTNNVFTNNTLMNNTGHAVWFPGTDSNTSVSNRFFNNYFYNNTNLIGWQGTAGINIWNSTKISGLLNIIGGSTVGGNYWANPSGTGFSQTCTDVDHDGICDSSYTLSAGNIDNLPLTNNPPPAPASAAAFHGIPTSGPVPLAVTFTDDSTGSPTGWAWFFGDEKYNQPWTLQTASAAFGPRIDFSSVVLQNGTIVLMGGFDGSVLKNDTWQSMDNGVTWTKMFSNGHWVARNRHCSVAMPDGSIVLMGGFDASSSLNDVWRSTDNGATWTQQTAHAAWSARGGQSCVALPNGSIVLTGGSGSGGQTNEVWRSEDNGVTWAQPPSLIPWSARQDHSSVVMPDGSIVLTGGFTGVIPKNDTWRSPDYGTTWTLMSSDPGWLPRSTHASVVMPDGSIVLMGGAGDGVSMNRANDSWRSIDRGATWSEINASSGWAARADFRSEVVPDGSIVLAGGDEDPGVYGSDVWRFNPVGSSLPSPSHTYTAPGTYSVALQSYNAGGYNSTRKAGYITVTGGAPVNNPLNQSLFRNNLERTGDYSCSNCTLGPSPTNNLKWKFTAPDVIFGSATVANNVVYVGCNDAKVYALDADTGSQIWNYTTGGQVESTPAVADGVVYVGGNDGHLYALNADTGAHIWDYTTAGIPPGNRVRVSPAVAYGNVYFGSDNHIEYALNASTGAVVWSNSTGNEIYSSPAVSNGAVFFGSYDGYVYAMDAMTGIQLWSYHTLGNPVLSTPAIDNNTVYIGGWDWHVYALNATSGAKVWDFATGASTQSSPAVADGVVYIGSEDNNVYALNAVTGAKIWNFSTGYMIYGSSPALADGVIYIGSYDNKTHAINASTGSEIWNYSMDGYLHSSPVIADGTLYIGSWGHTLYALGGAPATGSIAVSSTPAGASIWVDDNPVAGVTPYTVTGQNPGYHHVRVSLATYYPQETSVKIESGTTATASFPLDLIGSPTGNIAVNSTPMGAEIYLDEADMGHVTPYTLTSLLGDHVVKITHSGYFNASRQVTVAGGATVGVNITMDALPTGYDPVVVEAINKTLKEELDDDTTGVAVSAPKTQVAASLILSQWGENPPIPAPASKSSVVFIDEYPGANWAHNCSYTFIDASGQKTVIHARTPSLDIVAGLVAGTPIDPRGADLNNLNAVSTPSTGGGLGNLSLVPACTSSDCSNNYALLIDGGYNKTVNHIRYWNDISFMYQTLNKTYGYPKDHITVLMSDGGNNKSIDRHNATTTDLKELYDDSPVTFDNNMYGTEVTDNATYVSVKSYLTRLKNIPGIATKDIFIFTTGHGDWNGKESILYLWDQGSINATEFNASLPTTARSITVVMEQCNSGGFADKFTPAGWAGQKRMFAAAAAYNQPSKDNGYSSTWTMAAARINVVNNNQMVTALLADDSRVGGNGDQNISIWEASNYAQKFDPYRDIETPQYKDYPVPAMSAGKAQYLNLCKSPARATLTLTSPSGVDTWYMGYKRNITWVGTGLGSTTVKIGLWNNTWHEDLTASYPAAVGNFTWTIDRKYAQGTYDINITSASPVLISRKSLTLMPYAAQGWFNINTTPDKATISLDAISNLKTNQSKIAVSPGTHMVGLSLSGYQSVEGMQTVTSARYKNLSFPLTKLPDNGVTGGAGITSSPVSAEVVLNGVGTGLMTPYYADLAPGTYTVTVRADGYKIPANQQLSVTQDQPASMEFTLIPSDPHRAVFRSLTSGNNWFMDTNMDGVIDVQNKFGQVGDLPLVGDFNRDGVMDRAVFRSLAKGNNWFIDYRMDGTTDKQDKFGQVGDIPLIADFNKDSVMDRGVFRGVTRGNNWFVDYGMDGSIDVQDRFGQVGDLPLVGDFNRDGVMDRAVFRGVTSGNNWFVDYGMDGTIDVQDRFGQVGDLPLAGDFNHDGVMDRAVFRSLAKGNNWFIDYRMDGTTDNQDRFGQAGDIPLVWNL